MNRRLIAGAVTLALMCGTLPSAALAVQAGLDNYTVVQTYKEGQFTDVSAAQWFSPNVQKAYELGLINGQSDDRFAPDSNLTIAEALKLAACLNSIYYTGKADFEPASPWYLPYVEYCKKQGIMVTEYANYDAHATRAEFAMIFEAALPSGALTAINTVEDNAIPDVSSSTYYASAVYTLYRAGILTGSDTRGTFNPTSNILRSEVAAIVTRMADSSLRKSVNLVAPTVMDAEAIFAKCSPAVFYIEVYDANGKALASGSGFFSSANGLAVTNYHVIQGAASAKVKTADGKVYTVTGVYDYDVDCDIALLQVQGNGFAYLDAADSASLTSGATIFAIGSPLGLDNTISQGIISSPSRVISGNSYIQITAPISHGSSGGALLNTNGLVIGITSASIEAGQNINLAIPINQVALLKQNGTKTLAEVAKEQSTQGSSSPADLKYYADFPSVPDFGAYVGVKSVNEQHEADGAGYFYDAIELAELPDFDALTSAYLDDALPSCGYDFMYSYQSDEDFTTMVYYNSKQDLWVQIGSVYVGRYQFLLLTIHNEN